VIRAKMRCVAVTRDDSGGEKVQLRPAYGKGNEAWSKATPGGDLWLAISNPEAQGRFVPGLDYFLDLHTAAVPQEPAQ
jgi:hypothetical protein